jgi:hypothetical protein
VPKNETPRFESLAPDRVTIIVPIEDFDSVGGTIDEHEQMAGQRIVMKMILDDGRKPVERFPHVDRFGRNVNRTRETAQHDFMPPAQQDNSSCRTRSANTSNAVSPGKRSVKPLFVMISIFASREEIDAGTSLSTTSTGKKVV